jgi:tetratricopeptide (TPR) repeat protein
LKLAADHARATYANGDAIRLYREAIKQVNETLLSLATESGRPRDELIELNEALGDLLALAGQRDEARTSYGQALSFTTENATCGRARLYRKMGKTWETQHQHHDALRLHRQALDLLGSEATDSLPEQRAEWIQLNVDLLRVFYWLGDVPGMESIVRKLQPVVELFGSPIQQVRFYHALLQWSFRRDRYVVDDETLGYAKAACAVSASHETLVELPLTRFLFGFALLFHNSLDEADVELRFALDLARRAGDAPQQARCLTYLTLAARLRVRADDVRKFAADGLRISESAGMRDYIASARANEAWLALREARYADAEEHARAATQIWNSLTLYPSPFQWMALLPLLKVILPRGGLEEAVACVAVVRQSTQQRLPGLAEKALILAQECWAIGDRDGARGSIEIALNELTLLGYA